MERDSQRLNVSPQLLEYINEIIVARGGYIDNQIKIIPDKNFSDGELVILCSFSNHTKLCSYLEPLLKLPKQEVPCYEI